MQKVRKKFVDLQRLEPNQGSKTVNLKTILSLSEGHRVPRETRKINGAFWFQWRDD